MIGSPFLGASNWFQQRQPAIAPGAPDTVHPRRGFVRSLGLPTLSTYRHCDPNLANFRRGGGYQLSKPCGFCGKRDFKAEAIKRASTICCPSQWEQDPEFALQEKEPLARLLDYVTTTRLAKFYNSSTSLSTQGTFPPGMATICLKMLKRLSFDPQHRKDALSLLLPLFCFQKCCYPFAPAVLGCFLHLSKSAAMTKLTECGAKQKWYHSDINQTHKWRLEKSPDSKDLSFRHTPRFNFFDSFWALSGASCQKEASPRKRIATRTSCQNPFFTAPLPPVSSS